ncbi:hypothetical protein GCM10023190_01890 [Enteractinococcus fodinae]
MIEVELRPLARSNADRLIPLREAMPDSVSPAFTVYVEAVAGPDDELFEPLELPELDADAEPESLSCWPGKMIELVLSPLARSRVERLTPCRAAMPESVSPALTV